MKALRVYHSGVLGAWRARDHELRSSGVDVHLVAARSWVEGGAPVGLAVAPDEQGWVSGARTWGRHPFRFVYDPRPIWRELRSRPVEVLDVHEEPASLAVAEVLALSALARRGRPRVCLYSAQNIQKRYPPPFRWLERLALRRADAVHTCNAAAGEVLRRKGFTGLVRDLGLGVDVERFSPSVDRSPAVEGPLRVGYVGRLEHHKGVHVLLDALVGLEEVEATVVGGGPARDELVARAGALGLGPAVRFEGFVDNADLPDVYRRFDVVVVPSIDTPTWIEQFGRVAVEAMASGAAVVASESGALPEVLDGAGVLVPPGDSAALRRELIELRDDRSAVERLRRAGVERAAHYSWGEVAARHRALYEEILP